MAMKRFADDYETVIETDEKGREKKRAVYRGDYFDCSLDQDELRSFRRNSFFLASVITCLHLSSGFVNNQGMVQFYISLPYVFAFFPLMYLITSIFLLPREKRRYQRDEIGLSFDRLKRTSRILLVLIGIEILGELVFLFSPPLKDQLLPEYLYLTLEALTAAALFVYIRSQRHIRILPSPKS